jgi:hypothetical protein
MDALKVGRFAMAQPSPFNGPTAAPRPAHRPAAALAALGSALAAAATLAAVALPQASHAEGIVQVLQRSQQVRLDHRGAAEGDTSAQQRLRASLERLLQLVPQEAPVTLRLVGGDLFAEAVFGQRLIAASEGAAELPEGERLFLLGHELGHLVLGHWGALSGLYLQHIPGEVRPETTDPVARVLGVQAHELSHRHELEADAFAYALVRRLGFGVDTAYSLLSRQGMQHDSATHPGTRRRLAQLRALEARLAHDTLNPPGGWADVARHGAADGAQ